MKLKTKFQDEYFNLEEVADVDIATMPDGRIKAQARAMRGGLHTIFYKTKAEFDADWEDAPDAPEEPEEYWYVSCDGRVLKATTDQYEYNEKHNSGHVSIGNYFSSKEEAELAGCKLKAWQRLKDKGFKFDGYDVAHKSNGNLAGQIFYDAGDYSIEDIDKEMDLLFGGVE